MLLKVGRGLLESSESADSPDPSVYAEPTVSARIDLARARPAEPAPKAPPVFDPNDPRSVLRLARYRVWRLRRLLRQKVAISRSRSRDPLSIWNDNVSGVMDLARAFGTRLVAEKFYGALEGLDQDTQQMILPLFRLWALSEVRTNAAWFLAEGCISEELYRELPEHADRQLGEIEGCLDELLEGLGVNHETLRAPIADDYVEHYERLSMNVPVSARVPTSRMTKRSLPRG